MSENQTRPEPGAHEVSELRCPKCGSVMHEGFILDDTYTDLRYMVTRWVEGTPQRGFLGFLKINNRRSFTIQAYRCPQCGYLELYACREIPS